MADVTNDAAEGEGAEGTAAGKKFKLGKLALFGAIGVVALVGLGAGLYFSGLLGGGEEVAGTERPTAETAASPATVHYVDLDEMVVSLGGAGRKTSFLKLRVSLELQSPADEQRIKSVMPRIVDSFQVFLRELRIEELQGSHGLYRVKEELLHRVNAAAHPTKVRDVLFREMIVQ